MNAPPFESIWRAEEEEEKEGEEEEEEEGEGEGEGEGEAASLPPPMKTPYFTAHPEACRLKA